MSRWISGPIVDIVRKFDRAVDVVISGHTHRAYVCNIDGRLVTSGDKFGTVVTAIDVKLDPATRDIVSARADNVIVRTGVYASDPQQTALLESYDKLAAPIANRPAGSVTRNAVAQAQQCRRKRARRYRRRRPARRDQPRCRWRRVIAFTNPGGIRTDIQKTPDER